MVSEDDESFVAAFTLRTSAPRVKSFNDRAAHHEMQESPVASALGASVTDRQHASGDRRAPIRAGRRGRLHFEGKRPAELVRAVKAALAGGAICRPKHRGHPSSNTTADCRTKPCQIVSIRFCE